MTTPRIGHIFRLAQIIKESCEQCTDQEATSLAKAILEHPGSHWSPTPQPVAVTPLDKLDRLIAFDRDNPTPEATNE